MNLRDIAHIRLHNLQISQTRLTTPVDMVRRLIAVQSQDYAGAKWSLGLRLRPTTDSAIDKAFNGGEILRTHMMRPTWHFVTSDDIRWILALTSPRVHQVNGTMYRQLGLDSDTLARGAAAMTRALRDGGQLTRDELRDVLEREGIATRGGPDRSGQRLAYIVMWAELEGLICSGPRRGKQFTYMLLDERAPNAGTMAHDEALAELIQRYYQSHGPATAADFARWSGLTLTDTRQGLEDVGPRLRREEVEGLTYWYANDNLPPRDSSPTAYLMSIYDEYTIGYKDYGINDDDETGARLTALGNALQNVIILDGRIAGTWRRTLKKAAVIIELNLFAQLTEAKREAVGEAAQRYGEFLGLTVGLEQVEQKTSEGSANL